MSAYLFPISFTFLPQGINSKILVAVFGIMALAYNSIRKRGLSFSPPLIMAFIFAAIFSVWCLYSVVSANTYDLIYADYLVSFLTWMFGAYGVFAFLSIFYEKVDLTIMTRYLALASVFQCVTAVMIDNNAAFSALVDRFMDQGQDFYKQGHRLYGIGAALDPAGIRFSTVQIMLAHQFSTNMEVREDRVRQATLLVAFAVILIIGSVISRTTLVGSAMGVLYMIIYLLRMRKGGFMTTSMVQSFFWFFIVILGLVGASVYFYETSDTFQFYVRFGFEAFFAWIETGEFSTGSTDVLDTMWVWPEDLRTWLVGRGTFGVYDNNTDIGYCNFTLYCGLIGMMIFSCFFLHCHLSMINKFREFRIAAWMLVVLTFVIWIKVTTDIFFINALLFCAVGDAQEGGAEANDMILSE